MTTLTLVVVAPRLSLWTVYRCYDVHGVLLYVGCSGDLDRRLAAHSYTAPWRTDLHRVETEQFDDSGQAFAAEDEQIWMLGPLYNRPSIHDYCAFGLNWWVETGAETRAQARAKKRREELGLREPAA